MLKPGKGDRSEDMSLLTCRCLSAFCLKCTLRRTQHKAACHVTKCNVINDIKIFPLSNAIISDVALQKEVN